MIKRERKQNANESENKQSDSSPLKRVTELEDEYAVISKIANSKSLLYFEGYSAIEKSIFDPVYTDPDESEYCSGNISETDQSVIYEGYALHRKKKTGYD